MRFFFFSLIEYISFSTTLFIRLFIFFEGNKVKINQLHSINNKSSWHPIASMSFYIKLILVLLSKFVNFVSKSVGQLMKDCMQFVYVE